MTAHVPDYRAGSAAVIDAVVVNVEAAMAVDEKNPALKTLQVSLSLPPRRPVWLGLC